MAMAKNLLGCLMGVAAAAAHGADVTFSDVSTAAGVGRVTESYGASIADVNGDGFPDIFVSNHRTRSSLYVNQRDGTFVDVGERIAIWRDRPGEDTHGGAFADIDNDGDQDLLVTVGQNNDQHLLVNENGSFSQQARAYDIATAWIGGRLPVWYDYNNDRLIDVTVAQYAGVSRMYTNRNGRFTDDTSILESVCVRHHYGQLLDITGDGRLDFLCSGEALFPAAVFDMTLVPWKRITWQFPQVENVVDSALGDFNNDGRMDLFMLSGVQTRPTGVSQHGDHRVEFRTQGGEKSIHFVSDGTLTLDLDWNIFKRDDGLTRVLIGADGAHPAGFPLTLNPADAAGMPPRAQSSDTPAILIGFDTTSKRWTIVSQTGNKWSDVYLTIDAEAPVTGLDFNGFWPTDKPARPTLLTAMGNDWIDTTEAAGLTDPVMCASVTTGDYNNDMYLDLYFACRDGAANLPNVLYYGSPDGSFRRAPAAAGAEGPVGTAIASGAGTADSAVSADFDGDGFLDLFVTNGFNMRPKFAGGPGKLFRNEGNANNWVMLDLVGTQSAPDAVGARVTATAGGVNQLRVQNGGYHRWSQEHARIHFGMAQADVTDIAIEWPSGIYDLHAAVPVNRLYRAVEGGGLEVVDLDASEPPPSTVACGRPEYDPQAEAGLYVWQECGSDAWGVRAVGGGGGESYTGILASDVAYASVTPFSVESNDTLNSTDPNRIEFQFQVWGQWEDGVDFVVPASPNKCFSISGSAPVYYGRDKRQMPASFNPSTLETCQVAEEEPDDGEAPAPDVACGRPAYDPNSEAGLYLWQACGSDDWGVRAVGGGGGESYTGTLASDVAYASVTPFSVESNDTLNSTDPNRIEFQFQVWGQWEDGVDFTVAPSQGKCFTISGSAPVYYGQDKRQMPASFNPSTLEACQ